MILDFDKIEEHSTIMELEEAIFNKNSQIYENYKKIAKTLITDIELDYADKLRTNVDFYGYFPILIKSKKRFGDCEYETNGYVLFVDKEALIMYEDPSDGYRSYCSSIYCISYDDFLNKVLEQRYTRPIEFGIEAKIGHPFPTNEKYKSKLTFSDDFLENTMIGIYCKYSGKPLLEVGTSNVDEYYPSFIFNYYPETIHKSYMLDEKNKLEAKLENVTKSKKALKV